MGIIPAIGAGASVLGALGVGRQKAPDYNRIIANYRAFRPQGWTSAEDRAFVGREQDRMNTAAGRAGEIGRYNVNNRLTAMGLLTSPAALRSLNQVQQTEAAGREAAAGHASDQLYGIYKQNEGEDWGRAKDIFGAQLGVAANEQRRHDLQQSTFYNSLNQFLPTIMGHFGGGGGGGGGVDIGDDGAPVYH